MIDERDIREMLQRRACEILPIPTDPEDAVRRARRRLTRTGVVGAVVAVLLVAGVLSGVRALDLSNGTTPAVPSQPPVLHEGEVLEVADDGVTLVATDTATRDERTLARCSDCYYVRKFAPSAEGRWIAYEAITCGGQCKPVEPGAGIWVVGATGPPIHVTTGGSWNWAWSPTTEQLAFVVGRMHGTELVLLDPATGERTSIAAAGGLIYALAWSPDGSAIAYTANSLSGTYVVRPGASPERIGGPSPGGACCDAFNGGEYLVWSPDGSSLAVSSHKYGVTVVRIDGSGNQTVLDWQPQHIAWSPDSRRIAYVQGHDVGIVSAIGGAPVILARAGGTPGIWSRLVWSPDGTVVAFTQGGGRDWYAVPADGSGTSEHIDRLEVERWIQG